MMTPSDALRAIEDNEAGFLLGLGRAGGAEERREPHINWTIGGSPIDYHNAVFHLRLSPENVDAEIDASIDRFRAHSVPGTWHVSPAATPADLGQRLKQHGFGGGGWDVGMAADLSDLPDHVPAPDDLTLTRVRDRAGLDAWAGTRGLDPEGLAESRWAAEMYARIGLDDDSSWRHYIGRLGDTPVAAATLFMQDDIAGIYFVLTRPEARRRGIGAAITLHALLEARSLGCHTGVLGASEMGLPVYRRLGFREYGRFVVYEWHPPDPTG